MGSTQPKLLEPNVCNGVRPMPKRSKFRCPIAGCSGCTYVDRDTPAPYAARMSRVRICRKCKCRFLTTEVVSGAIQLGLPICEESPPGIYTYQSPANIEKPSV